MINNFSFKNLTYITNTYLGFDLVKLNHIPYCFTCCLVVLLLIFNCFYFIYIFYFVECALLWFCLEQFPNFEAIQQQLIEMKKASSSSYKSCVLLARSNCCRNSHVMVECVVDEWLQRGCVLLFKYKKHYFYKLSNFN